MVSSGNCISFWVNDSMMLVIDTAPADLSVLYCLQIGVSGVEVWLREGHFASILWHVQA